MAGKKTADHLTGQEHSRQALEHSQGAHQHTQAVLRKNPILRRSDRFRKDFRSEMLKRHVTLIDLAEGVQALRAND